MDPKNKTDHSEHPDNNDIIDLTEEVEIPHDSPEVKGSEREKSDVANNDEDDDDDLIVLKEEVQVFPDENEDIIELTNEVSMTVQEELPKATEITDAAIERVIHKIFAEKIDFMIREAIKKVLEEDLENIKKRILNQHPEKG